MDRSLIMKRELALPGIAFTLLVGFLAARPASVALAGEASYERDAIVHAAVATGERFWRRIADDEPYETMSARKLFAYGMALCEGRQHSERLQRLYELAARMQDRNAESRGYGNIRWTWRDSEVTDRNAVEFCMQDAVVVWTDHRDWMPKPARNTLRELMDYGVEGCLRHRVSTSYTNIAILNAGNLISLGELLDRSDATEEGYRRLDAICLWTWSFGTHEYCSPTYTGVDIEGLGFIHRYAKRDSGRQQAAMLLELLWTDVAVNWFPPAGKLAGTQSRSYDYLRGLGYLSHFLRYHGWLDEEVGASRDLFRPSQGKWSPPDDLRTISDRYPRQVRQSWGLKLTESRTHVIYSDVTLSTSGAAYGSSDMPLTIDLPGASQSVRCYFIADGRGDPYGKKRYETSSARHMKALHLRPFWAGAQRGRDALGVVIYRDRDLAADVVSGCQSHFVLRRNADGLFVGGIAAEVPPARPSSPTRLPFTNNQSLVIRYATAAVGIRVVWSRARDGMPTEVALVDDGNLFGALRLTIEHNRDEASDQPGAAIWVRIGTGLGSDQQFDAWRRKFEQARAPIVEVTEEAVRIEVPGEDGPVSVAATAPYGTGGSVDLRPEPTRGVLEIDGTEIGRPLLEGLALIQAHKAAVQSQKPIELPAEADVGWEAETGLVFPGMDVGEATEASGGHFVWCPQASTWSRATGTVTWELRIAEAGTYYLWGRVLAPDPETDSFYVAVSSDARDLVRHAEWHTRHGPKWRWERVTLNRARKPTPLDLPAGRCRIQFKTRETGTKIDRLFLTPDPRQTPE